MTTIESRWDDEVAFDVLQRHAAEDLHAGIYDSYLIVMRALRNHFSKVTPNNDAERATLDLMDEEYAQAMRDERPLVPVYTSQPVVPGCTGAPRLSLLELYRVEPDTGLVVPTSAATVARVDSDRTSMLRPSLPFSEDQLHQLIDHHEELMDNGLVPQIPK